MEKITYNWSLRNAVINFWKIHPWKPAIAESWECGYSIKGPGPVPAAVFGQGLSFGTF